MNNLPAKEQRSFFERALQFFCECIRKQNIVSAVVHMDEKTPHMHLPFCPITKDGKLSAKTILGNQKALSDWQTDFHKCMSERYPELERGLSSMVTHRTHIPTWLLKKGERLDKMFDEIRVALSDIGAFNAGIIDKLIEQKLAEIAAASEAEILESQHEKELDLARIRINNVKENLRLKQKDLDDFKAETIKIIRGTSKFNIELLNSLVTETEQQISSIEADLETAETKYRTMLASAEALQHEYNQLLAWGDLYRESSFEAKKMIVSQFVKAVRVGRDYNIEVEFNVSFEDFQQYCIENGEISDATMRFASA